jgi:hypothetical protein
MMVIFATRRTQVQETGEFLPALPANKIQMTTAGSAFIATRFVMGPAFAALHPSYVAVSCHCH